MMNRFTLAVLAALMLTACGQAPLPAKATNPGAVGGAADAQALQALSWRTGVAVRYGYRRPGDAPPLTYTASRAPCSIRGGDGGAQVPTADGGCWIASFARAVDVREFGAACDGSADDSPAIQASIDYVERKGGGVVGIPAGAACAVKSTLRVTAGGVSLTGAGLAGAKLICETGSSDCLRIGFQARPVYSTRLSGLYLESRGASGGWSIDISGAALTTIDDVIAGGVYNGIRAQRVNSLLLSNDQVIASQAGGDQLVTLYSAPTENSRSDVITLENVTLQANFLGRDCLTIDGMVQTVRIDRVGLMGCRYGLRVRNSAESHTYYPEFIFADDLEIDGVSSGGVWIEGGNEFDFVNSDIAVNNPRAASAIPFRSFADRSGSYTRGIRIANSSIHDSPVQAAVIEGAAVQIVGSQFFNTNIRNSGALPDLELGPQAEDVTITGSFLGERFGDPAFPRSGLQIDAGASRIALGANDYDNARAASIDNRAATPVQFSGAARDGSPRVASPCPARSAC